MTRENKLALIIGFGLLLFVGILVSDHMAARPLPPAVETAWVDPTPPVKDSDTIFITFNREPPIGLSGPDAASVGGGQAILPPPAPDAEILPPAPAVQTHVIREGETFSKVAGIHYGKKSLGTKLAEFNGIRPEALQIGDTIRIPDPAELDPSLAMAAVPSGIPVPPAAPPVDRTYKVREGDTYYRIAQRELGSPSRVAEIERLNNIKPSKLRPGMTIRLPGANDA
jgi:nucleoid-associated protein YgaU